jgi:hypothetical protein
MNDNDMDQEDFGMLLWIAFVTILLAHMSWVAYVLGDAP